MALIQRSDLGQAAVGDEINSLSAPAIGRRLPPPVLNPLEHFALSVFQSGRRTGAPTVGKLKGGGHRRPEPAHLELHPNAKYRTPTAAIRWRLNVEIVPREQLR